MNKLSLKWPLTYSNPTSKLRRYSKKLFSKKDRPNPPAMLEQTLKPHSLWSTIKSDLGTLFPREVYNVWFEPLECLEEQEDSLRVGVPNEFAAIWIQDNYAEIINTRASMSAGRRMRVQFDVLPQGPVAAQYMEGYLMEVPERPKPTPAPAPAPRVLQTAKTPPLPALNARNTFSNFVIGPSNQLAHAASVAVANAPARAYNPLFLYGGTGLGKTHLMQAVAHHILNMNHEARVVYVSSEKFTNEFIRAIQENSLIKFRKRYREVDLLLIDDIQFLSGKERIQEEFFHTFNELYESQSQIFLSSDRPAGEISKLESRLVSRFQWGLVTDIQPPDFETRVAILSKKAEAMNLILDPDLLHFLAERVSRNIRRMEGALTRIGSYITLMRRPVNQAIVEDLLQDILQEEAQNILTIERIQKLVCEHYQIALHDMCSRRRPNNIAFPRQIAMFLSRTLTHKSLQEIGDAFGGRDHGTVIHAYKTVENMVGQDVSIKRTLEYLTQQLTN